MRQHSRAHNSERRGLAMLLVIISVIVATVLATAYLASRVNSVPIGSNVESSASARWAALSAIDVAVAVIETQTDWRTADPLGELLTDYPLAGALVDVVVRDVVTKAPPDDSSEYVELTASATVDGITQQAVATAYVPLMAADTGAGVDLAEFVVFAHELEMYQESTLSRWPRAPLSPQGQRLLMGTPSLDPTSFEIRDNAACLDTTLYHVQGASNDVIVNDGSVLVARVALADPIPFPPPPETSEPPSGSSQNPLTESMTLTADYRTDKVELFNATLVLQGDLTFVTEDDLTLDSHSKIVVDGDVVIVVFDDVELFGESGIELRPDATLTMYVSEQFLLEDGFIGQEGLGEDRDHTGYAEYIDPNRIRIYNIYPPTLTHLWRLRFNSVVTASVYAPGMSFELQDESALYGRVAADHIRLNDSSAIFYDHRLDARVGFNNPESAIFDGGSIRPNFVSLTGLSPDNLQVLADATGTIIHAFGIETKPTGWTPDDPPDSPPGEPTARSVAVEYEFVTFGNDVTEWEFAYSATGGGGGGNYPDAPPE